MLEDFIKVNKLPAKIFAVNKEVQSAAKAIEATGDSQSVAKSIVLIDSDDNVIVVVILGKDRVDFAKVKELFSVKDVRLASAEEVFQRTGYEIGGVPPISIYGVTTLVDKMVLKKEEVICGGGDKMHLMKIKVSEIIEFAENVKIEDARK